MKQLNSPVLFLIFNRPDTTYRVFEEIRRARPARLYVAADGPRPNRPGEDELCRQTRDIVNRVDWECHVVTLFREQNLGCRPAVSSAIDWFFTHEEEGIILEDDCLPDQSFFSFCAELLEKYRHDERIMHIGGANFQYGRQRGQASYYFSRIPHIWGWASWRRAWRHYDVDMQSFPDFVRDNRIAALYADAYSRQYWLKHFRWVYGNGNTWDYQWGYTVMRQGGYCITPNQNLISNIGFGAGATHATETNNPVAALPLGSLPVVTHPAAVAADTEADLFTIRQVFHFPPLLVRAKNKIKRLWKEKFHP